MAILLCGCSSPGEWNLYEIKLDGSKITVLVNGKKLNEADECDVLEGPMELHLEGGEIHFRNLRLIPSGD